MSQAIKGHERLVELQGYRVVVIAEGAERVD